MEFFGKVEGVFDIIVNYLILFVELVGILVLIYAVVSSVIGLFRHKQHVRLKLAEGIALSLEFKMGGELLRTVIVREWKELLILGAIIIIRAALAFLIQWEIKIERKSGNMTESEAKEIKTPLRHIFKKKKQNKLPNNKEDKKINNEVEIIKDNEKTDSEIKAIEKNEISSEKEPNEHPIKEIENKSDDINK